MKIKKSKIQLAYSVGTVIIATLLLFSNNFLALAAATPPLTSQIQCPDGTTLSNGVCLPNSPYSSGIASSSTIMDLALKILQILLAISGVIAVLMVVIGGFMYVTSGGNEEQAEKGKKVLINAGIGLAVVVLAYALITILTNTLTGNTGVA